MIRSVTNAQWFFCLFLVAGETNLHAQKPPYDVFPPAEPPYYRVRYEASQKPGELIFGVNYTIWIPPHVPRNGQSRVRANSIPLSIPSMLLYGLPGEAQSPSKDSSVFTAPGSASDGVGSHWDSTFRLSFEAACWSASLVA